MFRDFIIFLAGAEAFHTFSHILLAYMVKMPMETNWVVLTPTLNYWAIIINGLITIGLLWYAQRLKRS